MERTAKALNAVGSSSALQLPLFDAGHGAAAEDVREWARAAAEATPERLRASYARAFCSNAVSEYWNRLRPRKAAGLRPSPGSSRVMREGEIAASAALGDIASGLPVSDAAFLIGSTYAAMLPAQTRAKQGIYYTPPHLVERLLQACEEAGVEWDTARVLDPACGGGAFLGPVAARMVESLRGCNRRVVVRNIVTRLHGLEIDPFAAWMSQVFLEATLHSLLGGVGSEIPEAITVCDSLVNTRPANYDLTIGNPPYGRVALTLAQRQFFRRSLFGHANLYGVFLDLAIHKTSPSRGVIAYVTPTSMLSGEYFKRLRALLACEANPVSLHLLDERFGIFDGVLQETLLAVYRRGESARRPHVHFVGANASSSDGVSGGEVGLPDAAEAPWILPRTPTMTKLAERLRSMPTRLADWGYKVSTGPLVWNRHKERLRLNAEEGAIPLIWAEAVSADGTFLFRATRRNHLPYFAIREGDDWLRVTRSCVLLQRTTSKEQPRRLVAAELPQSLIDEYGAVTVENHLNMLVPIVSRPKIDTATLAAFLNSVVADRAFRCISGSVAVSAYELEACPLPSITVMNRLSVAVRKTADRTKFDRICAEMYE